MRNKLIFGLLLCGGSMNTFAHFDYSSSNIQASGSPDPQQIIDRNNLPAPGSGVQIVESNKTVHAMAQDASLQQEKIQGYINEESGDAIQLLADQKNKLHHSSKKIFYENSDPYNTHLKASLSQIKLAFPYHAISFIDPDDVIGFAAAGTWMEGWTGIGEVFNHAEIGVCDYVKFNYQLTHGAARLNKDYVTYDVNNKPTITLVKGTSASGYAYKVEWFGKTFFHILTCVSKDYVKENKERTIALAKKIDTEQQ